MKAIFLLNYSCTGGKIVRFFAITKVAWFVAASLICTTGLSQGIQWATSLSWEQVKEKARKENKYILVDAYATWCAPCKKMDKEIFPLDSVGDFYNSRFIPIKVQMDMTRNDHADVVAWRNDATEIKEKYGVNAFPTYLFFSPSGELVAKKMGAVDPGQFISWGREALTPGLIYVDPLARYKRLIADYKNGAKNYDSLYSMTDLARSYNPEIAQEMLQEIYNYLKTLPEKELYSKERIRFIEKVTATSQSKFFYLFHKKGKKINKAMDDRHYAQRVVDAVILRSIVTPFTNGKVGGLMQLMARGKVKADTTELDWAGLEKAIAEQFDVATAKRNVLSSKFLYYFNRFNYTAGGRAWSEYIKRYGLDANQFTLAGGVNGRAWPIFQNVKDPEVLNATIEVMEKKGIKKGYAKFWTGEIDTYACLLYKVGRVKEAIEWERKALDKVEALHVKSPSPSHLKNIELYTSVIERMKKGEKLDWFD